MTGLSVLSLLAVAAALVRGGSLASWGRVHVEWWFLAVASLGMQLLLHNPPIDREPWAIAWGPLIWIGCLTTLFSVLVRNAFAAPATRIAWTVSAIGVGLNLLVVVANGGYMPQSAEARLASRGGAQPVQTDGTRLRNVVAMTDETHLNALGDLIAEPAWLPQTNVISIGDLFLGAGLAGWAFATTRHKRLA